MSVFTLTTMMMTRMVMMLTTCKMVGAKGAASTRASQVVHQLSGENKTSTPVHCDQLLVKRRRRVAILPLHDHFPVLAARIPASTDFGLVLRADPNMDGEESTSLGCAVQRFCSLCLLSPSSPQPATPELKTNVQIRTANPNSQNLRCLSLPNPGTETKRYTWYGYFKLLNHVPCLGHLYQRNGKLGGLALAVASGGHRPSDEEVARTSGMLKASGSAESGAGNYVASLHPSLSPFALA